MSIYAAYAIVPWKVDSSFLLFSTRRPKDNMATLWTACPTYSRRSLSLLRLSQEMEGGGRNAALTRPSSRVCDGSKGWMMDLMAERLHESTSRALPELATAAGSVCFVYTYPARLLAVILSCSALITSAAPVEVTKRDIVPLPRRRLQSTLITTIAATAIIRSGYFYCCCGSIHRNMSPVF